MRIVAGLAGCVLLSGCVIEPLTPTATVAPTDTPTPQIALASLLPTLEETPTPIPPPTATPTVWNPLPTGAGNLLFRDPFESNSAGWLLRSGPYAATTVSEGVLTITVRTGYTSFVLVLPMSLPDDAYVEVITRTVLCGSESDTFGLVFREFADRSYRYAVACSGRLRMERYVGLALEWVSGWKDSPSLLAGAPAENRIGVLVKGSDFHFFVNGMEVLFAHETLLVKGKLGVFAKTEKSDLLTVSFDEFAVYSLAQEAGD